MIFSHTKKVHLFLGKTEKIGNCETIVYYMRVIQIKQTNAGMLSLPSARNGTKFEAKPLIKCRRPHSTCLLVIV